LKKMSKGSWYRPYNRKKWDKGYERIFGKKRKKEENKNGKDNPKHKTPSGNRSQAQVSGLSAQTFLALGAQS